MMAFIGSLEPLAKIGAENGNHNPCEPGGVRSTASPTERPLGRLKGDQHHPDARPS